MIKEKQIEEELIEKLVDLKYLHRKDIHDKKSLENNFREKFSKLNRVNLSDTEFYRLKEEIIKSDVFACSQILRSRNSFEREDGTPLHYTLVNTKDWCKNSFEVINQLRINTDNSYHRYDVILLINGIPVVQIELKNLGISPRRAMQQIVNYKKDIGNGYTNTLLCFMQIFIVSNQSDTLYFANNNSGHFSFDADEQFLPIYRFAEKNNSKITHLEEFAEKFLKKCTLGEMISRYMVSVVSEKKLMMMRPYQIYAVENIINCIHENRGDGYIWHTTGSGKTLTSFKASTLLKDNPDIDKCLFVVDRKDLDRQTRNEFNKFQEGCVEENTNTETLVGRLLSDDYADKVIVTTIQKLGLALDSKQKAGNNGKNRQNYKERLRPLADRRIVFIFDECHRSQFGENHKAIREFFPKSQLFGFTGTPIFDANSTYRQKTGKEASYKTTEDLFQKELHSYTITDAIEDKNVLRFHIDYFNGEGESSAGIEHKAVVGEILKKHDAATGNRRFNAIFATNSINDAIDYYKLFKEIQVEQKKEDERFLPLNIASVFSPPAEGDKDIRQIQEDLLQEKFDNKKEPNKKKEALKAIIADYNSSYGTNHDINKFDLYYQDVQERIKDHKYSNHDYPHKNKIDIIIVVDMLLTGFDSKYLNTLYVDKKLKYHGLIQAFSRTNRVLNDTKPYGNILDFRGQEEEVDTAITLFSGKDRDRAKEIWLVDDAPTVIKRLETAVSKLNKFMASQGLSCSPEDVINLNGNEAKGEFIKYFKEIQRLKTELDQYTDLSGENRESIEKTISEEQLQAFRGVYLNTVGELKALQGKSDNNTSEEVELEQPDFELILFASAIIDYDYIMNLIYRYTQEIDKQEMSRKKLIGLISSDSKFMNERDDIIKYIDTLKLGVGLREEEIKEGYTDFKKKRSSEEIDTLAEKYKLESNSLKEFVDTIMKRMIFDGELLTDLFEPLDLNWKSRSEKELDLMAELIPLFKKLANGRDISGLEAYDE